MRLIDADAYQFPGDLENEPTIDAVPVAHGRWLKNPSGFTNAICSCCAGDSPVDSRFKPIKTNFCPNCGAKMDGDGKI